MSGVEIGFGVVSLAGQLLHGCIEGYKLVHAAKQMGRDGDLLYTKLAVQRSRLEAWAYKAGLPDGPFKRLDWDPMILILGQQKGLLQSAKELQDLYQLDDSDKRPSEEGASNETYKHSEALVPTTDTTSLVERLRPLFIGTNLGRQNQAGAIQRRNTFFKKASWAAFDKTKLKQIVNEITILNGQLVEYLNDHDQEEFRREVGALCRALVSECRATDEVENIRQSMPPDAPTSIFAAAQVKKLRLTLKFNRRGNEVAPRADALTTTAKEMRHYNAEKLVVGMETQYLGMRIALYDDTVVMVEWRTIAENWNEVQSSLRQLAWLLRQADDCAFHTVPCLGYVDMEKPGRFGFVYDITQFSTGLDPTSVQSRSLFSLFPECPHVSVVARVRIACDVAEAITQLHTAGWLHKGVCSENVVFVAAARSRPRTIVSSNAYLIGYGYARPDTISAAVMTELPVTATNRDVYRHPSARGQARQSFQMRFDLYGLACVLVELALWKRMEDIMRSYFSWTHQQPFPSLNELFNDQDFLDELSFHVGPRYIKAIELCLAAPGSPEHDQGGLVGMDVLESLRSCQVV